MADILSFDEYRYFNRLCKIVASKPPKPYKPERQGSLDGLCGVYCIVNAVGYVATLSPKQRKQLFKQLVKTLDHNKRMAKHLLRGTSNKQLCRMLVVAQKWLAEKYDMKLSFAPLFRPGAKLGLKSYLWHADGFLQYKGSIIIAGIEGIHNHWTCVTSISPKTIQLLDSDGLSRLRVNTCRLSKAAQDEYHCFHPLRTWGMRLDTQ